MRRLCSKAQGRCPHLREAGPPAGSPPGPEGTACRRPPRPEPGLAKPAQPLGPSPPSPSARGRRAESLRSASFEVCPWPETSPSVSLPAAVGAAGAEPKASPTEVATPEWGAGAADRQEWGAGAAGRQPSRPVRILLGPSAARSGSYAEGAEPSRAAHAPPAWPGWCAAVLPGARPTSSSSSRPTPAACGLARRLLGG